VKRIFKISAILGVSVVWCLILGVYCGNTIAPGSAFAKNSGSESFISDVSNVALFSNERTEASVNFHSRVQQTNVKNSFNQFSACQVAAIKLFSSGFLPFRYCPSSSSASFKTTDIIFPFHYFW
jgi:hypothetical protein